MKALLPIVVSGILVSGMLTSDMLCAASPIQYDLAGTDSARHRSVELERWRASVFLFLATDCPISNRYSPLIHRLETEYGPRRIAFRAVFSEESAQLATARKYLSDYGLDMIGLTDPSASLARQTGARVTPEAVVLSSQGAILYRGRLDDRYVDWGKTRPEATEHDLQDALEAILAGKPVLRPFTRALGCAIPGF